MQYSFYNLRSYLLCRFDFFDPFYSSFCTKQNQQNNASHVNSQFCSICHADLLIYSAHLLYVPPMQKALNQKKNPCLLGLKRGNEETLSLLHQWNSSVIKIFHFKLSFGYFHENDWFDIQEIRTIHISSKRCDMQQKPNSYIFHILFSVRGCITIRKPIINISLATLNTFTVCACQKMFVLFIFVSIGVNSGNSIFFVYADCLICSTKTRHLDEREHIHATIVRYHIKQSHLNYNTTFTIQYIRFTLDM